MRRGWRCRSASRLRGRMLVEVLDHRGVDEFREREALVESEPLEALGCRGRKVDGLANLDDHSAFALHEGPRRNRATRGRHARSVPQNARMARTSKRLDV